MSRTLSIFIFLVLALRAPSVHSAGTGKDVLASWYGPFHHGKMMASGAEFNMFNPWIVAHTSLPLGTRVKITNPVNGLWIIAVVLDRMPPKKRKPLLQYDLSWAGAEVLGFTNEGITRIEVEIM